jgi:UDP-N-acetylmuramyl pentapeptide phosphotransferase/UDP-N-acetylglucosamine-1-phosphate transferase
MTSLEFIPLVSFAVSLILVWGITLRPASQLPVDIPNERSLHKLPVPRGGGLGIVAGFICAAALISYPLHVAFWISAGMVIAVSLADDFKPLPARLRLIVHLSAAAVFCFALLGKSHGFGITAISILAMGWMANLYNFMDGSDGLAGGMQFALLNASVSAAAAAFLLFNFHPARIFMGDVGSVTLGFFCAAFGLSGWINNLWPWWFPVIVFSPFIIDSSLTLAKRFLAGQPVSQAHRDHYYQRLVRMGLGHRLTALAEYTLMIASGLAALAAMHASGAVRLLLLGLLAIVYAILILLVEVCWKKSHASAET